MIFSYREKRNNVIIEKTKDVITVWRSTMKVLWNDGWKFCKFALDTSIEEMLQSEGFVDVDIPHDWLIYDAKQLYENSIGCYKKYVTWDENDDGHFFLRFEGVYMDTSIYVNGIKIAVWKYGYSTFEVEITEALKAGENEVCVVCVYRSPNSRWYSGAGIYRNVYFVQKAHTYFVSDGSYVSTQKTDDGWRVPIDIEINETSRKQGQDTKGIQVFVKHMLQDENGTCIATSEEQRYVKTGLNIDQQELYVDNPMLWDTEHPYLYTLTSQLWVDDQKLDETIQRIGFKTIRFDPDRGFFLNEKSYKIQGSCEHHDLGALGAAMNSVALRRKFKLLKEMGVNSVRSAHNMPSVEFMDLADEMGLLVYSESFDMWERPKTEYDYGNYFKEWWEKDVRSWIRRDRNHASLLLWGIGNEIYDTHLESGYEITKQLRDAVRALDPRKNGYIAIGSNYIAWENAQRCSNEVDVSGYNYMEHLYDEHHKKYPNWCIFGSETSSTVQSRGIYHFPLSNRLLTHEDRQCSSLGNCTTNWGAKDVDTVIVNHRDREFCFGQYIWTGWDYIGEPTPYFSKNSFFGQIDTAGFKKDTFYHYQAEWTSYKEKPMIHILPYWDFNEGQQIDICVYSNAPYVELFFNDVSQGKQCIDHANGQVLQGIWNLRYTKGTLVAKAYDETGRVIASAKQSSFGDPVELVATPDKYRIKADGEDLVFVEISTIDDSATLVANARNRVQVMVSGAGRLIGLDNGDSTDYDSYKGTNRKLFSGKLLAIIAAKKEPGFIHIDVSSNGLRNAHLDLVAVAAKPIEGLSAQMENERTQMLSEIPVRKIELICQGDRCLTKEQPQIKVEAILYPKETTYSDIVFRAMTLDGVESNCVTIEQNGTQAILRAKGDGEFRLCCSANNGCDHPEVISELECRVEDHGRGTYDPYTLVSACHAASISCPSKLSFEGGMYLMSNERAVVTFEDVDFGDYGSDEITIPIFSFEESIPLEVWIGKTIEEGRCLLQATYEAKSWYNHYQSNTFLLNERIRGKQTIHLVMIPKGSLSLQGFYFKSYVKAYATLFASDASRITGDAFEVEGNAIVKIGNNVTIEYDGMEFGEHGFRKLILCGRSRNECNTIHVRCVHPTGVETRLVEFPWSEHCEEKTFFIECTKVCNSIQFLFLPGSNFDFHWFRFEV